LTNLNWEDDVRAAANELYRLYKTERRPEYLYQLRHFGFAEWMAGCFVMDDGKPYSFDNHKHLLPIAEDTHPFIVTQKSVQSGFTVLYMGKMLYHAVNGHSVIYYLPNDVNMGPHVKGRVFEVLENSPYLQTMLRDGRRGWSQECIVFKTGAKVYHRGIESKMATHGTPAEIIMIDEVDRISDVSNIDWAKGRLRHSKDPHMYQFCTPTVPGFGVNELFTVDSDRREWLVKCLSCNHWSELKWIGGVVEKISEKNYELRDVNWSIDCGRDIQIYCEKCGAPLDRLAGQYVPQYEHKEYHGYHVSELFSELHTLESLRGDFFKAIKKPSLMQLFFNLYMGEPYIVSGSQLSPDDLQYNIEHADWYSGEFRKYKNLTCVLGIDVNPSIGNHYAVMDMNHRIVEVGIATWETKDATRDMPAIDDLYEHYNIVAEVIDHYPEVKMVTERQKRHPNVYLAEFKELNGLLHNIKIAENESSGESVTIIQIDRTLSLDKFYEKVKNRELLLPSDCFQIGERVSGKSYNEFAAQLMALIRSYKRRGAKEFSDGEVKDGEGLLPTPKAEYRDVRPDHWAFACDYALIAGDLVQNLPPTPQWRGAKEKNYESDIPDFLGEGW
jgi:hypothetical protein